MAKKAFNRSGNLGKFLHPAKSASAALPAANVVGAPSAGLPKVKSRASSPLKIK